MYAIETKKRKFDRILETIKDSSNSRQPNVSTSLRANDSTTLSESGSVKKRRVSQSKMGSANSSMASLAASAEYLPASREAFLDRLETFGPIIKWHVPSTEEVSAAVWAKRGWRCVDVDTVGCKACKAQLLVKVDNEELNVIEEQDEEDEFGNRSAVPLRHRLMVERFRDLIVSAHTDSCPWRARGCDDTIQRITGMLNVANTLKSLRERYDGLERLDIPQVYIREEEPAYKPDLLTNFRFGKDDPDPPNSNRLRLALCGWEVAANRSDVAECHACFRSLGLWMYRGPRPLMEKLDAVENHLEYCPWRSGSSQHTEITLDGKKSFVPAWALIGRAVNEEMRKQGLNGHTEKPKVASEELGEVERENKVKDLLRRVKELKRPFSMKLLRRKKAKEI